MTKTELPLIAHKYTVTKTVAPTCITDGYKESTCFMCKDVKKEVTKKALGHDYKLSKTVNATCTKDGYKLYECSRGDDSRTETLDKSGHDFTKLVEHKDSSCTEQGYDLYQCTRCDETTKTMSELKPHDYDMSVEVERVESTCGAQGHVSYKCKNCDSLYTVSLDPVEHNYKKTSEDLEYITYTCSECGDTKQEYNDKEYTIDLGYGRTTTVVGHFDLEMRQQIYELVCARRKLMKSNPITLVGLDTTLQDVANIRAYEITYSYSHTRPNGERAIRSFYSYACTEGENLATGSTTAENVCERWFCSSSHDNNIISNNYGTIAIGVFCKKTNSGYTNYFSQMFSPKDSY